MTEEVVASFHEYTTKVRAIVKFGHAHPKMGERPGEFYQVTIDPNMVSPGGGYIRFGQYKGDEIQGWERVEGLTVCEVLGPSDAALLSATGLTEDVSAMVQLRTVDG